MPKGKHFTSRGSGIFHFKHVRFYGTPDLKEVILLSESKLRDLSVEFSVNTIKLCENIKGHSSLVNQLERSATSIGANIREAQFAHGKADFISKLQIALKECSETEYWIELLIESGYYHDNTLLEHCTEVKRILIASINTVKANTE